MPALDAERATALAALRAAAARHHKEPLAPLLRARGLGPYRGYGELLAASVTAAERGAGAARLGRSPQGEPLFALHFGARPTRTTRTTVVLAGVHPMEWIGVEVALRLVERLVATELEGRSVIVIPVVNPDGLTAVEGNLRARRRRFVRHNAHGVDLNRNFDVAWGRAGLVQRLLRRIFAPGPRPASEPEVESIAHHLSSRRVDRALSLHSFGGAVLTPYAARFSAPHDAEEHATWARRIARAADPRRPYRAVQCSRWGWNTAGGLELDWFHDRHGALSLLVECSRGGRGLRPSRLLDPFAWFNPVRLDEEADRISGAVLPFVKGLDP
jgi:hypothetical protein